MSRLQEIKENWAKGQGFDSWEIMRQEQGIDELDLDIISKEYATECVKASLDKASENVKIKTKDNINELSMMDDWNEIDKSSITNPENIVLL